MCILWSLGLLLVYVKEIDVSRKKSDCTSAKVRALVLPSLHVLHPPSLSLPDDPGGAWEAAGGWEEFLYALNVGALVKRGQ